MLVSIVRGFEVLTPKIHHRGHQTNPSFGCSHRKKHQKRIQQIACVHALLDPVPTPQQTLIFIPNGGSRISVSAVVEIILVDFHQNQCKVRIHDECDSQQAYNFGEQLNKGMKSHLHAPIFPITKLHKEQHPERLQPFNFVKNCTFVKLRKGQDLDDNDQDVQPAHP